ncbi:MAG: hypothetical protein H0W66_07155 [Chthoniobacterales bacterium]|nr:hypothetical protein [Chthoniobacterales bacterium]
MVAVQIGKRHQAQRSNHFVPRPGAGTGNSTAKKNYFARYSGQSRPAGVDAADRARTRHADRSANAPDLEGMRGPYQLVMSGAITAKEASRRMPREAVKNIADSNL